MDINIHVPMWILWAGTIATVLVVGGLAGLGAIVLWQLRKGWMK